MDAQLITRETYGADIVCTYIMWQNAIEQFTKDCNKENINRLKFA
jgi:hypothetical protein